MRNLNRKPIMVTKSGHKNWDYTPKGWYKKNWSRMATTIWLVRKTTEKSENRIRNFSELEHEESLNINPANVQKETW